MTTLGARLEALRALADLSARELSALAGLSPSHARMIETSPATRAGADTILALAQVFGVSVEYLLQGSSAAPAEEDVRAAVLAAKARRAVPKAPASGHVSDPDGDAAAPRSPSSAA